MACDEQQDLRFMNLYLKDVSSATYLRKHKNSENFPPKFSLCLKELDHKYKNSTLHCTETERTDKKDDFLMSFEKRLKNHLKCYGNPEKFKNEYMPSLVNEYDQVFHFAVKGDKKFTPLSDQDLKSKRISYAFIRMFKMLGFALKKKFRIEVEDWEVADARVQKILRPPPKTDVESDNKVYYYVIFFRSHDNEKMVFTCVLDDDMLLTIFKVIIRCLDKLENTNNATNGSHDSSSDKLDHEENLKNCTQVIRSILEKFENFCTFSCLPSEWQEFIHK